jgi:hypothetical protein
LCAGDAAIKAFRKVVQAMALIGFTLDGFGGLL